MHSPRYTTGLQQCRRTTGEVHKLGAVQSLPDMHEAGPQHPKKTSEREGRGKELRRDGGVKEGRTGGKDGREKGRKGKREKNEERKGGEEGDGARRKGKKERDVKKILLFPNNNKF